MARRGLLTAALTLAVLTITTPASPALTQSVRGVAESAATYAVTTAGDLTTTAVGTVSPDLAAQLACAQRALPLLPAYAPTASCTGFGVTCTEEHNGLGSTCAGTIGPVGISCYRVFGVLTQKHCSQSVEGGGLRLENRCEEDIAEGGTSVFQKRSCTLTAAAGDASVAVVCTDDRVDGRGFSSTEGCASGPLSVACVRDAETPDRERCTASLQQDAGTTSCAVELLYATPLLVGGVDPQRSGCSTT